MGIIGRGVKLFHLFGVVIAFSFCLWHIPLWNLLAVNAKAEEISPKGGALTVIETSEVQDDGDGDGIVTDESNDEKDLNDQSQDELFEPTTDWKPVKKGQKIQPGLHVRLNLQTGEREAKLMGDTNKKETKQWFAGEKIGVINTEKQRFTRDELKKALKDFKLEESDTKKLQEKDAKTKKNNFRSYDELKSVMKEMQMSVKTEAEIVTDLLSRLREPKLNIEDMKTILIDMEYYLHQFDNARLFCDLGGMQVIIKLLNNTEEDIRIKSLLALGSAVQSNAKVQVNAVENGALQQLLKMISVDMSDQVKKRCLFALSALLRQFPFAQKRFLEFGGLSAVADLFSKTQNELLKIKIITLLTDLVQENDLISVHLNGSDEVQAEKIRQYSEMNIREALQRSGWCTHVSSLLHEHSEHDNIEKILSAMLILRETCQDQFHSLHPTLQSLSRLYSHLAEEDKKQDETDDFFHSIYVNIKKLQKDIGFKQEEL